MATGMIDAPYTLTSPAFIVSGPARPATAQNEGHFWGLPSARAPSPQNFPWPSDPRGHRVRATIFRMKDNNVVISFVRKQKTFLGQTTLHIQDRCMHGMRDMSNRDLVGFVHRVVLW